jgi:hypothetical protein
MMRRRIEDHDPPFVEDEDDDDGGTPLYQSLYAQIWIRGFIWGVLSGGLLMYGLTKLF